MPTGHGDGAAICRLEDSSRFGQPFSFLRCSGWRARRRLSPPPNSAQARAKSLVVLPSIRAQRSPFALLSSLFTLTLQMSPPHSNAPPSACSKVTATSAGSYIVMHSPDSDFTAPRLSLVNKLNADLRCQRHTKCPRLECAPGAGQVEVSDLTGCAGLSKDESHGQTTFPQH